MFVATRNLEVHVSRDVARRSRRLDKTVNGKWVNIEVVVCGLCLTVSLSRDN